jgi:hypothetical protein
MRSSCEHGRGLSWHINNKTHGASVFFKKLEFYQLVNKFCITTMFVNLPTESRHLSLPPVPRINYHWNIFSCTCIRLFISRSSKWPLYLGVSNQILLRNFFLSNLCCTPRPSNLIWLNLPKTTWRGLQIIKSIITQFFPLSILLSLPFSSVQQFCFLPRSETPSVYSVSFLPRTGHEGPEGE